MTSSDFEKKDLSELIQAAQAETESRSTKGKASLLDKPESTARPLLFLVVLLALVTFCGVWLWSDLKPASREQVTADLEHVLIKARESIEAFRSKNGKLPTALPNASLSSVVKYVPVKDQYILIARTRGVHLVLPPDQDKPVRAGGQ